MDPQIEIIPASPEHQPILAHLLELYVHDFSEFYPVDIGDDGRFTYPPLPLYWSEAGRHPFLVKVDGKLAGLALVKSTDDGWDMAEFFILRGCRRLGIGTRVAHEVFTRFPGRWEVRVMDANISGQRFWAEAIAKFVGEKIEPSHFEGWLLFSFAV